MPSALRSDRLLSCLLAALLVTAGLPEMAASPDSSAPSPPVMFADDVMTEQRGDVVEIGVLFSDAEVATVRIGSEANHVATVVVRDEDGDGRATLRLNTYDGTITPIERDSSSVRERSSVETPIAAETYDLDLWIGNGTDGERWAVGILGVEERVTNDLRTWIAPGATDLPNQSAIVEAKASGNLTRSDTVTRNDTLVLELRASGLEGALAAQSRSNVTSEFFGLFVDGLADIKVVQINPGPSIPPKEIHLAEYDSTHVVADPGNDSYYLVADLPDANVTGRDGELDEGDVYEANLSFVKSSELTSDGSESVTAEFEIVESRNETTNEPTTVDPETTTADSTTVSTTDAPMREVTSESPTATTDETDTTGSGTDGEIPGLGVSAALVAVVTSVLLALRRQK